VRNGRKKTRETTPALIGRVSSDPELFNTERGTAIANARVAVDRCGPTPGAVFVSASCFEGQARTCAEHLPNQRPIAILRRLKLDGWEPTTAASASSCPLSPKRSSSSAADPTTETSSARFPMAGRTLADRSAQTHAAAHVPPLVPTAPVAHIPGQMSLPLSGGFRSSDVPAQPNPQARSPASPRLAVTRAEAATALGMSINSFERHVQPELRIVRRGKLRLIPLREIERWLDNNAEPTLQGPGWGG
jgi:single-stranded DNA-binding protein